MSFLNVLNLIVLGAIWGGSFIFMRILVPPLGSVLTADGRALIAGLFFSIYFVITGHDAQWKRFWKQYLIIGAINSALPFALFAYAAKHIPASYSAVLNATAPLFGAVFSALWLSDPLTLTKLSGVVLGTAGVAAVAGAGSGSPAGATDPQFLLSILGCLVAAICYALSAVYIKKFAKEVKPISVAGATQLAAGLLLLPFIALDPPAGPVTQGVVLTLVAFALLCSGIAFVIYFRLIDQVGPTRALTVTFLIPVFGILFGALLLGERITLQMVAGCALIIAGTALVLRKT